jgi:hypothetical protein
VYLALRLAKYKTALIIAATIGLALFFAPATFAAQHDDENGCRADNDCGAAEECRGGLCVDVAQGGAGGDDVFGVDEIQGEINLGGRGLQETITGIINVALSLLGIIAVVIILIGGFKWMTAGGSEEKVADARKLIFAGIIGLAIIMSAWAIAKFVINSLATETAVPGFQEIE